MCRSIFKPDRPTFKLLYSRQNGYSPARLRLAILLISGRYPFLVSETVGVCRAPARTQDSLFLSSIVQALVYRDQSRCYRIGWVYKIVARKFILFFPLKISAPEVWCDVSSCTLGTGRAIPPERPSLASRHSSRRHDCCDRPNSRGTVQTTWRIN